MRVEVIVNMFDAIKVSEKRKESVFQQLFTEQILEFCSSYKQHYHRINREFDTFFSRGEC